MSEVLDIAEAVTLLCQAAGIDPLSVADISIHVRDGYFSLELKDGSAFTFLTGGS